MDEQGKKTMHKLILRVLPMCRHIKDGHCPYELGHFTYWCFSLCFHIYVIGFFLSLVYVTLSICVLLLCALVSLLFDLSYSTENKIIMELQKDMQELKVAVKFNADNSIINNGNTWCDNIELFIDYDRM
jgi:hypothetical protein